MLSTQQREPFEAERSRKKEKKNDALLVLSHFYKRSSIDRFERRKRYDFLGAVSPARRSQDASPDRLGVESRGRRGAVAGLCDAENDDVGRRRRCRRRRREAAESREVETKRRSQSGVGAAWPFFPAPRTRDFARTTPLSARKERLAQVVGERRGSLFAAFNAKAVPLPLFFFLFRPGFRRASAPPLRASFRPRPSHDAPREAAFGRSSGFKGGQGVNRGRFQRKPGARMRTRERAAALFESERCWPRPFDAHIVSGPPAFALQALRSLLFEILI